MRQVYLDHHATTPVDPRVLDAMLPFFRERFGNPSSNTHPFGWSAQEAVERARGHIAALLNARPKEIVFTSGATEACNLALLGAAEHRSAARSHIVTQATEHHAVLGPIRALEKRGFQVTVLRPGSEGIIDPEQVREAMTGNTFLVSIMAANNEIGALQPLAEIGRVCREAGAIFHTDAAQAVGKIPIDVEAAEIDLCSISAHKYYGPKGAGALFVRRRGRRIRLSPMIIGGGQEGGLRSGTLNVPGIAGLGACSRLALDEMAGEARRIGALRDRLLAKIREGVPDARLNGPADPDRRLPGNLSVSFPRVDGAALLISLADVAASAGSACTAGSSEPSHVLKAIGVPDHLAVATLRLGLGRFTTAEDVDYAAGRIVETVRELRRSGRA